MNPLHIKKILMPVDFSANSLKGLDHAILMAKLSNAAIYLIHMSELTVGYLGRDELFSTSMHMLIEFEKEMMVSDRKKLLRLSEKIRNAGVDEAEIIVVAGKVHKEIVKAADEIHADIIVMGTHGVSGFREVIMGSNTFRVVHDAHCPVLSIQNHTKNAGFENILVPLRDKPHSREKVTYAIQLAKMYGATLHIYGVNTEEDDSSLRKLHLEAEQIKKIAEEHNVECHLTIVTEAYAADSVLSYAKKINADLVVTMSGMDRTSIAEIFMGPFVHQIINHSPIPVFSVRPTFNTDTFDLRFY
ncbi:MAG TPA: universal stress protein [Bacteroidia bacterium]|nr:universal stress protein [Bacteroidia bacterium]